MPSSTPTTYPYTFVAVWDALQRVLPHLGFQVVAADPTTGVLQLRGGSGSVSGPWRPTRPTGIG